MNFQYNLIAVIIALMCVAASGAIFARDLVSSLAVLGVFSLLATIAYSLMKSPDVAITEVAVGSAISSIFLLITIGTTGSTKDYSASTYGLNYSKYTISGAINLVATFALFMVLSNVFSLFPKFGDLNSLPNISLGKFYVDFSERHFGVGNVVTAILGGYRGFDTLIETTVGFCAALGVSQILSTKQD